MKLTHLLFGCTLCVLVTAVVAETGGTEDINIGVGELQEDKNDSRASTQREPTQKPAPKKAGPSSTPNSSAKNITNKDGKARAGLLLPAVQKARSTSSTSSTTGQSGIKKKKKGNVEYEWKIEEGEK